MTKPRGTVRWALLVGIALSVASAQAVAAPDYASIDRVAGTGTSGHGGDGGQAALAGVPRPAGVVCDGSGNFYISTAGGLRRVDAATGVITTIAGAAEAALAPIRGLSGTPAQSMCIDAQGNLFFAGEDHARTEAFSVVPLPARVMKYEVSTGVVTTIATIAGAIDGMALTCGPGGDLYVSSQSKHRVYRITLPSGTVSTVAGSGVAGFSGDGGSALAAQLNGPLGIGFDGAGDLYIADEQNQRVRKVAMATGTISTYLGDGGFDDSGDGGSYTAARTLRPCGILFGTDGTAFVREVTRIRRIDGVTGTITHVVTVRGSQGASNPPGMTLDPLGRLVFCSMSSHYVARIDPVTLAETRIAGSGQPDPVEPSVVIEFTGDGGSALLASVVPYDVAEDAAGNLFVSEFGASRVRRIDGATGAISTITGGGYQPNFIPFGIDLDASGRIILAGAIYVWRINPATGQRTVIAGNGSGSNSGNGGLATAAGLSGATDVAVDADGDVYVACAWGGVRRIDAATGIISRYAGTGVVAPFSGDAGPATDAGLFAETIALDASGNLFIVDPIHRRIRRVDAVTSVITTVLGYGGTGFGEGLPATQEGTTASSIAVDADGNIFYGERNTPRIRRIDAVTGIVSTVAGIGGWAPRSPGGDGGPSLGATFALVYEGLRVDHQGRLLVCDTTLRRIDHPNDPGVFLEAPASVVAEANTGNNSADVWFTVTVAGLAPTGATLVVDDLTGNRNLVSVPATSGARSVGGNLPIGLSLLVAKITDALGATLAERPISVQVADTLPPQILGAVAKTVVSPTIGPVAITPEILALTIVDQCDPAPVVTLSETELPLGTTSVTVTATDATGNARSVTFDVEVVNSPTASIETTIPGGETRTVDITFDNLVGAGASTVTTSSFGPDLPGGYQFGGETFFYEIETGATFTGTVTLAFTWNEGAFDPEATVSILHFENGEWVDITTSVDTVNNIVYAQTDSFSPFAVVRSTYTFTGVNRPIESDGSSVFRLKSPVPVRFQISRPGGSPATNAVARLSLYRVDPDTGSEVQVQVASQGNWNTGDRFRSLGAGRYQYNLATSQLTRARFRGEIRLDDGAAYSFEFSLR